MNTDHQKFCIISRILPSSEPAGMGFSRSGGKVAKTNDAALCPCIPLTWIVLPVEASPCLFLSFFSKVSKSTLEKWDNFGLEMAHVDTEPTAVAFP